MPGPQKHSRLLVLLIVSATLVAQVGCVQRRLTIRSNPPGALVYVDDYEIGTTPVSTSFIYYGTREIRLVKDGYETLTVKQPIAAPWYQYPGIDFFAENVVPGEIRDERVIDLQMTPQTMVPKQDLESRALGLRQAAQSIPVGLPPGAAPVMPGPQPSLPPTAMPPAGAPVIYGPSPLPPVIAQPAPPGMGPPASGYQPYP